MHVNILEDIRLQPTVVLTSTRVRAEDTLRFGELQLEKTLIRVYRTSSSFFILNAVSKFSS